MIAMEKLKSLFTKLFTSNEKLSKFKRKWLIRRKENYALAYSSETRQHKGTSSNRSRSTKTWQLSQIEWKTECRLTPCSWSMTLGEEQICGIAATSSSTIREHRTHRSHWHQPLDWLRGSTTTSLTLAGPLTLPGHIASNTHLLLRYTHKSLIYTLHYSFI